jgi:hypothetical protein
VDDPFRLLDEVLTTFATATVMSALFESTYCYAIWSQLGVQFTKSTLVRLEEPTTALGKRRLKIFWMTDQGWSKRLRDRSGGIGAIFDLIIKAGVLDLNAPLCVCTNRDDASEDGSRPCWGSAARRSASPAPGKRSTKL